MEKRNNNTMQMGISDPGREWQFSSSIPESSKWFRSRGMRWAGGKNEREVRMRGRWFDGGS
jgi:hypothetical protein